MCVIWISLNIPFKNLPEVAEWWEIRRYFLGIYWWTKLEIFWPPKKISISFIRTVELNNNVTCWKYKFINSSFISIFADNMNYCGISSSLTISLYLEASYISLPAIDTPHHILITTYLWGIKELEPALLN